MLGARHLYGCRIRLTSEGGGNERHFASSFAGEGHRASFFC